MFLLVGMFFIHAGALAQSISVSGTITDVEDLPVPGVNIMVKGTLTGTASDANGRYTISVPNSDAVLVFSSIGFASQEIAVGNRTSINVTLLEDASQLEEVVVVGYGVQKKETVTGAVSSVKGDEMLKSPATNLSHAIVGRMSGVVTYQRSGEPGYDDATVRIRGINSFGDNSPLVVIDGIADRAGGFSRLDPNEIESMSVLKDGAAAIYGARAANGVILITTKRGKESKPVVQFSSNFGIERPTILPPMADVFEYMQLRNELAFNQAMNNDDRTPTVNLPFTDDVIAKYRAGNDPWRYPNTDWYKETFKSWAGRQNHSINISGGSDKVQYNVTLGYRNQDNHFIKGYGGYNQYNLRINLDAQVNDWIKLGVGLLGRQQMFKRSTQSPGDLLWFTSRGRPTDIAYWPNGLPGPAQEYGRNPVIVASDQTGYLHENSYYTQSNIKTEITQPWIKGLKLTLSAAYDKMLRRDKEWFQPWYLYTWNGVDVDAQNIPVLEKTLSAVTTFDQKLTERARDQTNVTLSSLLTYDRTFNAHNISVLVGAEKETAEMNYIEAYRRYYLSSAVQQLTAGGDLEKNATSSDASVNYDRRRMNYFGRVAYNYQEKYLVEFLWRYDGSFNFPRENRYGFFPGILLGYRISEENFWKVNLPGINYFKIRGSWSQVGNDKIYYNSAYQEFQYLATYRYGYGMIIDGVDQKSLEIARFPNPNITWEVANMMNLGIEGRTFNNRLSFEVDVFLNQRRNILWRRNASIPNTSGLTLPAENIGEVDNKGFDFRLSWNDRIGKDFMYDITFTGGYTKNKIKFWDEAPGAPEYQKSTGKMTNTSIYYEYDGVFKDWDEVNDRVHRPDYSGVVAESGIKPGDMKFKDINGDGKIDGDDRIRINRTDIPKWNTGLNIMMQYKNFDLTLLFQGGFDSWTRIYHDAGTIGNWPKTVFDNRWSYDNPSSLHPRVHDRGQFYWDNTNAAGTNTYWMKRTGYVRLKNVEFGYNIPNRWVQQTGFFTGMRVFLNGQNVLTFTKLDRDPESTSTTGTNYPHVMVLNAGFTLTF